MEDKVISLDLAIPLIFSASSLLELLGSVLGHGRRQLIAGQGSLRVQAKSNKEPSQLAEILLILHQLGELSPGISHILI